MCSSSYRLSQEGVTTRHELLHFLLLAAAFNVPYLLARDKLCVYVQLMLVIETLAIMTFNYGVEFEAKQKKYKKGMVLLYFSFLLMFFFRVVFFVWQCGNY